MRLNKHFHVSSRLASYSHSAILCRKGQQLLVFIVIGLPGMRLRWARCPTMHLVVFACQLQELIILIILPPWLADMLVVRVSTAAKGCARLVSCIISFLASSGTE